MRFFTSVVVLFLTSAAAAQNFQITSPVYDGTKFSHTGPVLSVNPSGFMLLDGSNAALPAFAEDVFITLNVKHFGAIGDGSSHPLSTRYSTLAAAQVVCPEATSLTQEIDWCAAQAAIDYAEALSPTGSLAIQRGIEIDWPHGYYMHGTSPLNANSVSLFLRGEGEGNSYIQYTGSSGINLLNFGTNAHMTLNAGTSIGAGGSGYIVNDVLTCSGGTQSPTGGTPCQITVNTVSGLGVVLTYTVTNNGNYAIPPNGTGGSNAVTMTGGTGSGFTLNAPKWTPQGGYLQVEKMTWLDNGTGGIGINAQFDIATPTLVVRDMTFTETTGNYFLQAINCLACSYSVVENNHAYGLINSSTDFFYGTDSNALVGHYSLKFNHNYSHGFNYHYHIVNASSTGIQGPRWFQNDAVQGQDFLRFDDPAGTGPPEYTLIDNEAQIDGWFVDLPSGAPQDLHAFTNEIFIGNGGLASPPSTGGGFNLGAMQGAIVIGNRMSITGSDTPTVQFLYATGSHGIAEDNIFGNPAGVATANGVYLDTGSQRWYERGDQQISGISPVVTDNGTLNDTSLNPSITSPTITGGATISGNLGLNNLLQYSNALTATAAGSSQSNCYTIISDMVNFTTVSPGTGACLSSFTSLRTIIQNATITPVLIYPPSGTTINPKTGGTLNAPVTIPGGAVWLFARFGSGWTGGEIAQGSTSIAGTNAPTIQASTAYHGSSSAAVPACSSTLAGSFATVSDGKASPTAGGAYAAGDGSANQPVWCNSASWVYLM